MINDRFKTAPGLRVNKFTPEVVIPFSSDRAPKEVRGNYVPVVRQREEHEATAFNPHYGANGYRTGMGDHTRQVQRPGSDHKHIKSRGW